MFFNFIQIRRLFLWAVILIVTGLPSNTFAQSRSNQLTPNPDPRGPVELTFCSQNLENYGLFSEARARSNISQEKFIEKEESLVQRFMSKGCDLIAVQELVANSEIKAVEVLTNLANALRRRTNRQYEVFSGPSNDNILRQGFIVAKDRAEVLTRLSFERVELPKTTEKQKPRLFTRGPLEMQLRVFGKEGSGSRSVTVINIHFKSKRGGEEDAAALQWETHRMEMAEAIRRIVRKRHAKTLTSGNSIFIVAGDRNSHLDSASAKILEGILSLNRFQEGGLCRLSKRGVPLCKPQAALPQVLFSVLTTDPQTSKQLGTFRYKNEYSWIDEILMSAESLRYAWADAASEGDYNSGVVYEPIEASDHAMVWVKLNW